MPVDLKAGISFTPGAAEASLKQRLKALDEKLYKQAEAKQAELEKQYGELEMDVREEGRCTVYALYKL